MDPTTKEKLTINVVNSWKMWSNRATVAMGSLWTLYFTLPTACDAGTTCLTQHDVQVWFSTTLHIPLAIVAAVATALTVAFRVWPQHLPAAVALAKSEDAPQPAVEGVKHAEVDVVLPTAPAKLDDK